MVLTTGATLVIRKHMGFGYIGAEHAEAINEFYRRQFNPYLNFHRPCGVPEERSDAKGKTRKVYRWYATPWEILRQMPEVGRYLKAEVTIAELDEVARAESDTACARKMQRAKQKLFAGMRTRQSA